MLEHARVQHSTNQWHWRYILQNPVALESYPFNNCYFTYRFQTSMPQELESIYGKLCKTPVHTKRRAHPASLHRAVANASHSGCGKTHTHTGFSRGWSTLVLFVPTTDHGL